jgi:hypothetical protein
MSQYPRTVRKPVDGQPVSSAVSGRGLFDLEQRTDYLYDRFQNFVVDSQNVYLLDEPCVDTVLDSHLVYFDIYKKKWSPAFAELSPNLSSEYKAIKESYVLGLAKNVNGSVGQRKCDIYVSGIIKDITVSNFFESGLSESGKVLYLTNNETNQGKCTEVEPGLAIIIGTMLNQKDLIFFPQYLSLDRSHKHYFFQTEYSKYQDLGGGTWLYPHTEFPVFPPNPFTSCVYIVNKQVYTYGVDFTVDSDGLKYSGMPAPDPDEAVFYGVLYYLMPTSHFEVGVASLAPKDDTVIITSSSTGVDDTTGNLEIQCVPQIELHSDSNYGSSVVKNIVEENGHILLQKGPVVERLIAGNNIKLSSEQGQVAIESMPDRGIYKTVTDIMLSNAKENISSNSLLTYISFPNGMRSGIRCKVLCPNYSIIESNYNFRIRFFSDTVSGGITRFNIQYQILKPDGSIFGGINNLAKEISMLDSNNVHKSINLFSIDKTKLEPNSVLLFNIFRDGGDSHNGSFNMILLEYNGG